MKIRRGFTLVLAAVLTVVLIMLPGCGGDNNGGSSNPNSGPDVSGTGVSGKGRFVEKIITPENANIIAAGRLEDGTLRAYGEKLAQIYESSDNGNTWVEKAGPGIENVTKVKTMPDGSYIVATGSYDGTVPCSIKMVSADGKVSDIPIAELDEAAAKGDTAYIEYLEIVGNGLIYLSFMPNMGGMMMADSDVDSGLGNQPEGVIVAENGEMNSVGGEDAPSDENENGDDAGPGLSFSNFGTDIVSGIYNIETGEKVYTPKTGNLGGFSEVLAYEDKIYYIGYDGSVSIRNAETDEELSHSSTPAAENMMNFTLKSYGIFSGDMYSIDSNGIMKATGNNTYETIVKPAGFNFSLGNSYISDFIPISESQFIVGLGEQEEYKLYRIEYDENAVVNEKKVIKIWSLENNTNIRNGITEFLKNNSDAEIDYEVALNNGGALTAEDAVKNLNTEILAGNGPDIIVLDGLSPENYVNNGMLEELSGAVDTSGVYEKLVDKVSGGVYYLPTSIKVPMLLTGDENLKNIGGLKDLSDIIQNGKDKPVFDSENPFSVVEEENRPVMDFGEFDELFELLWKSSQNKIIENNSINTENLKTLAEGLKAISDKYKLFAEDELTSVAAVSIASGGEMDVISGSLMSYMSKQANAGGGILGNVSTSTLFGSDVEYLSFPGLETGTFVPVGVLGINSKSDKKEFAASFIEYMLSDDKQGKHGNGFAVTPSGTKIQKEEKIKMGDDEVDITMDMEKVMESLVSPVYVDKTVSEIVKEHTLNYINGESTLDQVIGEIQNAVKNYLAERAR